MSEGCVSDRFGVGSVVDCVDVHEIEYVVHVLECRRTTVDVVSDGGEKGFLLGCLVCKSGRVVALGEIGLVGRTRLPRFKCGRLFRLEGLDRDVLLTAERTRDERSVGEGDVLLKGRWIHCLPHCIGREQDHVSFPACVCEHVELLDGYLGR